MNLEAVTLREEIVALEGLIEGLPDRYRQGPLGKTYSARLAQLQHAHAELELQLATKRMNAPGINVRLDGEVGRIKALILAELVSAVQTLVTALGQAVAGRPTTKGMVPLEVQRRTTLEAFAFAPGSFIVQLVVDPQALEVAPSQRLLPTLGTPEAEPLAVRALDELSTLLEIADDGPKLTEAFSRLKGRVLTAYDNLLQVPENCGAELDFTFYDPRSEKRWARSVTGAAASVIRKALTAEVVREESEREWIVGSLVGANHRTGTFEVGLEDGSAVQGRAKDVTLLKGVIIGETYSFELCQVLAKDPITGASSMNYELISKPEKSF